MKCPKCRSKSVASILFGMPAYSEQLIKDQEEGKVVFGGCVIDEHFNPDWHCNECEYEWEKNKPNQGYYAESEAE